jgi:predicted membrane-bound spermidine synthase
MLSFAWWLSLGIGFLSLSQEIAWVRVVSFAYGTLPHAFSFVLTNYLLGIAFGALIGKRLCSGGRDLYAVAAVVLAVAATFDLATAYVVPALVDAQDTGFPVLTALAIVVGSGLKSVLFPIAHQLGSHASGPRLGRSVSRIYFGNIVGATLGPLVTGYVLLDRFPVETLFVGAGLVCAALGAACAWRAARAGPALVATAAAVVATLATVVLPPRGALEQMAALGEGTGLHHFIATRHGVVHTSSAPAGGDIVFGGNIYDGRTSVDPDVNSNRLDRLYMLALVHPEPKRVLVVGLSTGAWTRALQGFPAVDRIDVVEINPAYMDLIRRYPELSPVLTDPRVHVHVDDGRRWLRRNPDLRFDLIVQNTTYHWRANSTNVLSKEYMTLVRRHLAPGGVVTMNTTGSYDVLATARAAFPHAYRYANFVYAAERPLTPAFTQLSALQRPDGRAFGSTGVPPPGSVEQRLAGARLQPVEEMLSRTVLPHGVITDDNMLTEYRHGRRFGPGLLVRALPPAPRHFSIDAPYGSAAGRTQPVATGEPSAARAAASSGSKHARP